MLPGSPNQPNLSAMRWRLLQPPHLATTTPFSYDSRLAIFIDLVSQTLHVKTMARSCLGEIFKLEVSLTWKLDSEIVTEAGGVSVLESSWSLERSSEALLPTSVIVWRDLSPAIAGEGNANPATTRVFQFSA
uniref:Uncharacterized protein n=1 Tax=Arundo donax TaxID=35708 RepID=A0A0A9DDB1_ARUDO